MQRFPLFRSKSILWPVLLMVLPLLLFWRWLMFGEVLFWGTLLLQFWPWHQLVKTNLLAGQWPLWNPLLGNGAPLLANQQSAVFYPPNLLYLLLPVEQALTLSVILHLALAGGLMYAFARQLKLPPFAATVAALSYMFSGYLVGRTQFVVMINAAAWLPLLLLLGERLVTRRRWLDAVWLALALALQLLAGHTQLWFYSLLLLGAYTLFRSWQQHRANPLPLIPAAMPLAALAVAVALALLLSAAQLLPTIEFVTQSPRSSGAARYEALSYSFWPWRLVTLLAPDFFGSPAWGNYWGYATYWEDHAYQGVLPLLLALLAVAAGFKPRAQSVPPDAVPPRLSLFFAALAAIGLLLALGWNTPVYPFLFDYVPGFGLFRAPARLLIWYTVAISVLAGLGAAQFELTAASRRHWRRLLAAAIALTVAGLAGGLLLSGRSITFLSAVEKTGLLLSAGIGLLLLQPKPAGSLRRVRWQALVALFIAADLLAAALPLVPMLPPAVFTQPIAGAEAVKAQPGPGQRILTDPNFAQAATFEQYFQFKAFGPLNVGTWQPFKETLTPNFGVYAGLPAANNNDPLTVSHQQGLLDALQPDNPTRYRRIMAVLGVSHRASSAGDSLAAGPEIFTDGQTAIQQVVDALPRAYLVGQAQPVTDYNAALAALLAPDFDPRREVVIMDAGGTIDAAGPAEFAAAAIETDAPQRVALRVETSGPGWLVLTDTWYPGWQATVNGQPARIWQANAAFRAVRLEQAGAHQIVFTYWPRTFTFGLWTSLATGLILLMLVILAAFSRRAATLIRTSS